MTYIAELDPNSRERQAQQDRWERWDATEPGWDVLSIDPEKRRFVAEQDVEDADAPVFRRLVRVDFLRLVPGSNG